MRERGSERLRGGSEGWEGDGREVVYLEDSRINSITHLVFRRQNQQNSQNFYWLELLHKIIFIKKIIFSS